MQGEEHRILLVEERQGCSCLRKLPIGEKKEGRLRETASFWRYCQQIIFWSDPN